MAGTGSAKMRTEGTTVDNRRASYQNVRDVYNAPVIKQTVVKKERSVTYGVDKEDVRGLEAWSKLLIDLLGERNTKLVAIVGLLLGTGGIFSGVNATPAFVAPFASGLTTTGLLLLLVGASFVAALQYRSNTRCVKCNTFYAMRETGRPTAREVRAKGGVRRTVTRSYQCQECGHRIQEDENEFIEDEPAE